MPANGGIELWPFQAAAEAPIRAALMRHRAVIVVSPTGSGKSLMIGWLAAAAVCKGARVLVAVPKIELVRQSIAALARMGIAAGVIAARHLETPDVPAQVASIATLTRPERLARWAQWKPDLVLVDEAHHGVARSWHGIVEALPWRRLLGFSATAVRHDGRALKAVFGEIVTVATVRELTEAGWLSPVKTFVPPVLPDLSRARIRRGDYAVEDAAGIMNQPRFVGDAIEHYRRHCDGGAALGYAVDIAHSQALTAAFCAAGIRARHVDGKTPAAERGAAVAALGSGGLDVLFNVNLFSEGLDAPVLAGVLMLAPTLSLARYLQMTGRAMRTAPGKEFAVLLDHTGNTLRHGLYDAEHEWSLEDRPKRTPKAPVRRCPGCGLVMAASCRTCPNCGEALFASEPAPVTAEGRLVEADPATIEKMRVRAMAWRRQLEWAGANYRRLRLIGEVRGYHPGWAEHELRRQLEGGK
jgi:superfamily II DNA or RNA helicase